MSGGSFDYLFVKQVEDVFWMRDQQLAEMVDELETHWPHSRATQEARTVLADMRFRAHRWEQKLAALEGVFHSVEWWRSGDFGKDDPDESVARFEEKR